MSLINYYHRNWSTAIPTLPSVPEEYIHLAKLALPFVGMLYPSGCGRTISYAVTALNTVTSVVEKKPAQEKAWNLIRNIAELAGTIAELRIGLVVHTSMNLAENFYSLFKTRNRAQWGENIFHIVSNTLYLATFYKSSKKVSYALVGASLAVQGCWNLYKAYHSATKVKKLNDIHLLDATAQSALSVIYFTKAYFCYERFMRIHRVVQDVLVLMCSEIKSNEVPSWQSNRSKKLAQGCVYHLNQIRKRYGKDGIVVITSKDQHHLETGKIIAEKLGQGPAQVQTDSMMHDRIKTGWELIEDKEQRQRDPGYIAFHSLSAQNQWCDMPDPTHPNSESHAMVAERLGQALESHYAKIPNKQLPVFVLGSRIIQDYVDYLQLWTAHTLPPVTKEFIDGDITIIRTVVDENENTKFEIERLPRAQFRAPRRS
jgi:broad specificity phosphatase PhoE